MIPTYCRPRAMRRCLQSLREQRVDEFDFEVIVVDDGSPEGTYRFLDDYDSPMLLTRYRIDNSGPAAARNAGADRASGEYLLFTDDDCFLPSGFLDRAHQEIMATPNVAITGRSRPSEPANLYACASQDILDFLHNRCDRGEMAAGFIVTNNFVIKREAFRAAGAFNESFSFAGGEDREFGTRLVRMGQSARYAPALVLEHAFVPGFFTYCSKNFQYGRGAWIYRRFLAQKNGKGMRLERPIFYCTMITWPLRGGLSMNRVARTGLVTLAQIMVLAGFVKEALVGSRKEKAR
ncbi:MAG: glycosyltransferase family A protein [Pirellulaceae bacterium]